ncbi:MAG: sortase [Patescibacteria group bacterium]|nr:sortase [Patescibacteria group bacterium]
MSSYRYVKKLPKAVVKDKYSNKSIKPLFRKFSLGFVGIGVFFLGNVFYPIISYEIKKLSFGTSFLRPSSLNSQTLGSANTLNYQDPKNWFLSAPDLVARPTRITHYTMSIPKLGIDKAIVQIGGRDLLEGLIQYPGTALPGQYGNSVIFGHSVLPQFFNPKNYKTIFSTLPRLKIGDEISVNFDGIVYAYEVVEMMETTPEDISILEQQYDAEYMSLITCVPPGTYLKRLIVKTKLVYER